MNITLRCLPENPVRQQSIDLIKNAEMSYWLPVLTCLQQAFQLNNGPWQRIAAGANALFQLGDEVIIKLVPPTWQQQGNKEILIAPLLEGKLSLSTPRLIGSGTVDNWVFVIFSRLQGISLADVWSALDIEQKLLIMGQVGQLLRELRDVTFDHDIAIRVDWQNYIRDLISACYARHQRNGMPEELLAQVLPYIEGSGDLTIAAELRFMHMDIHPWNLMAQCENGQWHLTGLLDFGDAIVGNSDRFELLTPLIFMAQGNPVLASALIESYGLLKDDEMTDLQQQLMAYALIRPASDVGFCMQYVPTTGPRETWAQIARQMFPV